MDEGDRSNDLISEFGTDDLFPKKMMFIGTKFKNVIIWREYTPRGTQNLTTEDVINEIKNIPACIIKYSPNIILSPYCYVANETDNESFAFYDAGNPRIVISAISESRDKLIKCLHKKLTLQHEMGHAIDGKNDQFSKRSKWVGAMNCDQDFLHPWPHVPKYFVSNYAESIDVINRNFAYREDFADSVKYFSDENRCRIYLKQNFPKRYEVLKVLLNDNEKSK